MDHHRPTLNAGLVAKLFFRGSGPVLQGNQIFFMIFHGVPDPLSPLLIRPCTQHVSSCFKYSNVEYVTLCMLSNGFFCPKPFLNLSNLYPSGLARRFAESDLGLNCFCIINLRHFHFKTLLTFCMLIFFFFAYYFVIIILFSYIEPTSQHGPLSARQ